MDVAVQTRIVTALGFMHEAGDVWTCPACYSMVMIHRATDHYVVCPVGA